MTEPSLVWSSGRMSIQLLLSGEYRAINKNLIPKKFATYEEAFIYVNASKDQKEQ